MSSLRIQKVNALVQEKLSELLSREISLKAGVLVTIAKVDTTPDLRYTRVSVSAFPESEIGYTRETLRKETPRLQRALHQMLTMKMKPRLSFEINRTEEQADVVERLLKKISEEEPSGE